MSADVSGFEIETQFALYSYIQYKSGCNLDGTWSCQSRQTRTPKSFFTDWPACVPYQYLPTGNLKQNSSPLPKPDLPLESKAWALPPRIAFDLSNSRSCKALTQQDPGKLGVRAAKSRRDWAGSYSFSVFFRSRIPAGIGFPYVTWPLPRLSRFLTVDFLTQAAQPPGPPGRGLGNSQRSGCQGSSWGVINILPVVTRWIFKCHVVVQLLGP